MTPSKPIIRLFLKKVQLFKRIVKKYFLPPPLLEFVFSSVRWWPW